MNLKMFKFDVQKNIIYMGMFNLPGIKDHCENHIKNDICPLCGNKTISVLGNEQISVYEFRCPNCNPKIVIAITDSFIGDAAYLTLLNNSEVKKYYINSLKSLRSGVYCISTDEFYPKFGELVNNLEVF